MPSIIIPPMTITEIKSGLAQKKISRVGWPKKISRVGWPKKDIKSGLAQKKISRVGWPKKDIKSGLAQKKRYQKWAGPKKR